MIDLCEQVGHYAMLGVCGRGGFWVGYDSNAREDRCVNHCESDRLTPQDATPARPDTGPSTLSGDKLTNDTP